MIHFKVDSLERVTRVIPCEEDLSNLLTEVLNALDKTTQPDISKMSHPEIRKKVLNIIKRKIKLPTVKI
jgi:hypothetical protein